MVQLNLFTKIIIFGLCRLWFAGTFGQSHVIQINGRRTYLKGQQLLLNCTTTSKNYNNIQLIWTKDGQVLESKAIHTDTLQIIIPKVELTDSGGYRCAVRQQARVVRSVLVHVTVGESPSPPTNIQWRSVNFRICVSWSPVSSMGGFPVTYNVRFRCVTLGDLELDDVNSNDEIDSSNVRWHVGCNKASPISGREPYCCLDRVDLYTKYEAVVIATNRFGSSMSQPFNFTRDDKTTPAPPRSLKLQAKGYGEITLEWKPQNVYSRTKYAIYYSSKVDTKNKTIITDDNGQHYYRITELRPFTRYAVYVAAIDFISNTIGIPVGPVSIVTREEDPSDAPQVVKWQSVIYSDNNQLRNVTIHWKLPPKENWNGKLTKYIIQYRRIPEYREQIDTSSSKSWGKKLEIHNSSVSEGTISALRADSAYEVQMQMCNRAGCGGIGNRVIINAYAEPKYDETHYILDDNVVILCISLVSIVIVVALVCIIIVNIKKKTKSKSQNFPSESKYSVNKAEKV